jgi:hypothetical protein
MLIDSVQILRLHSSGVAKCATAKQMVRSKIIYRLDTAMPEIERLQKFTDRNFPM